MRVHAGLDRLFFIFGEGVRRHCNDRNIRLILIRAYTAKEVAQLLKTNVDYVHKLRKSGLLPFLKLGQYKVRKQALIDFLRRYEGKDLTNPFDIKELDYSGED